MKFFSKHKNTNEKKEASEIKQASISDSQVNSISQNPVNSMQTSQFSQGREFVNPFVDSSMGNVSNFSQSQNTQQQQNQMTQNSFAQTNDFQTQNPSSNVFDSGMQNTGNTMQTDVVSVPDFNMNNSFQEQGQNIQGMQQTQQQPMEQLQNNRNGMSNPTNPLFSSNMVQEQENQMGTQNSNLNNTGMMETQQSMSNTDMNMNSGFSLGAGNNKDELSKEKINEMIDETVEKIIDEKWDTLLSKVEKVVKWKEKAEAEINMLKEDLVSLGTGFNKLETKLINKISNYDKNILDVNSEIKALEKVFQKITPTLINNVNELSKITDELRDVRPDDKRN